MKKIIFIFVLAAFAFPLKADQLAWITKDQAEQTVKYFKDNDVKQVILFCGCCDKDIKKKVKVSKVFYRQTENPSYYEVVIAGEVAGTDETVNEGVDLAYTFINKDGVAACLGKEMGFECDPCTKPFKWKF